MQINDITFEEIGLTLSSESNSDRNITRSFVAGLLTFDVDGLRAGTCAPTGEPITRIRRVLTEYKSVIGGVRSPTKNDRPPILGETPQTADEIAHSSIAAAMAASHWELASGLLTTQLRRNPNDLLAFGVAHQVDFLRGDAKTMMERFSSLPSGGQPGTVAHPHLLAMRAFALCENGFEGTAVITAERSLCLDSTNNAWATHALAHSFAELGHPKSANAIIRDTMRDWSRANCAIRTHLWWHLAIATPSANEDIATQHVLEQANEELTAMQFCDVVSLIWRRRLHGITKQVNEVSQRLAAVADSLASESIATFIDFHILLAYLNVDAQLPAQEFAVTMVDRSSSNSAELLRASAAIVAASLFNTDNDGAAQRSIDSQYFESIAANFRQIGGSRIQRDILYELARTKVTSEHSAAWSWIHRRDQTIAQREWQI